ncbi:hypothetical protein [Kribbella sp. NPDC048915]
MHKVAVPPSSYGATLVVLTPARPSAFLPAHFVHRIRTPVP